MEAAARGAAAPAPPCALCRGGVEAEGLPWLDAGEGLACHLRCLRACWDAGRGACAGAAWGAARARLAAAGGEAEAALAAAEALAGALASAEASRAGEQRGCLEFRGGWRPSAEAHLPQRPLRALPGAALRVRGLLRLDVADQPLAVLPAQGWGQLAGLRRLSFCNTRLRELPDEICELSSLEDLVLLQNALRRLPTGVGVLPRLDQLRFTANQVRALPEPFALPKLTQLVAEGNELVAVPADLFRRCPALVELRLTGNAMERGPFVDDLDGPPSSSAPAGAGQERLAQQGPPVACAYLQGCRARALPAALCTPALRYLMLSENLLTRLPAELAQLENLRWLHLFGNRLATLPPGLLTGCRELSHCLLEGNPLSAEATAALLGEARAAEALRPGRLRALGVDAAQVRRCCAEAALGAGAAAAGLPGCVLSGWVVMPGWYGKLIPSSQLKRSQADHLLGAGDAEGSPPGGRGSRVLVVALTSSLSEPEWCGELARLHHQRSFRAALRRYRCPPEALHEQAAAARGAHPGLPAGPEGLAAACWAGYDGGAAAEDIVEMEEDHEDFDVLLVADPRRRWYFDAGPLGQAAPLLPTAFGEALARAAAGYGRVCAVGASMGGFAALCCADAVDAVLAFGAQLELETAPYRPGFDAAALRQASARLRAAVARRRGSVEVHTSLDGHLGQALALHPESFEDASADASPSGHRSRALRLVVHPFSGRCARVLERGGLLLPLLAEALARLQGEVRAELAGAPTRGPGAATADEVQWGSCSALCGCLEGCGRPRAPDPSGGAPRAEADGGGPGGGALVGLWTGWAWASEEHEQADAAGAVWGRGRWMVPTLRAVRADAEELLALARQAPFPGDWLCLRCARANAAERPRCGGCGEPFLGPRHGPRRAVTLPGGDQAAFRPGDWECGPCARLVRRSDAACPACGRGPAAAAAAAGAGGAGACENAACCTPPELLVGEHCFRQDPTDGKAYCARCWEAWSRYQARRRLRDEPAGGLAALGLAAA